MKYKCCPNGDARGKVMGVSSYKDLFWKGSNVHAELHGRLIIHNTFQFRQAESTQPTKLHSLRGCNCAA